MKKVTVKRRFVTLLSVDRDQMTLNASRGEQATGPQPSTVSARPMAAPAVTAAPVHQATRADRERKTFVTLSYIIVAYVVCWVPFQLVYDTSIVRPDLVSDNLFTITFWMTYVNSFINPFLYAFSSKDVRDAFRKIILCKICARRY